MLRQLPRTDDPDLLVGHDHNGDAGVYRVADGMALVQTVDFFPPLCDDPYVFGQITAANSLSDVYAMGGRPLTALNVVAFPDDKLPLEMLTEILRGGADKAAEAGATIVGGHTVRNNEVMYGLAVTGLVDPDKLVTNASAQAGDVLVLTKAIGTGAMSAAFQKNRIDEAVWTKACEDMMRLNAQASDAMLVAGAHAATDITGFGLLGHASEVAEASGLSFEIVARDVPLLKGAMELAKAGFVTRAAATNRTWLEPMLDISNAPGDALVSLLIDAQTSGGLLIALPESSVTDFGEALAKGDSKTSWAAIGRVTEKSDARVRLV